MKRDLAEFSCTMQQDGSKMAATVKEKLTVCMHYIAKTIMQYLCDNYVCFLVSAPQIWLASGRHCTLYKFIYLFTYLNRWMCSSHETEND